MFLSPLLILIAIHRMLHIESANTTLAVLLLSAVAIQATAPSKHLPPKMKKLMMHFV
jgi:hypothetical protein